ncbi:MAG: thioredoxin [Methanoregulaceae archaeon]|jgi:thioredoxin 1|nr:thioredoxin [Methanoregulaceae archaeon]
MDDELAKIRQKKLNEMQERIKTQSGGKVLHLDQASFLPLLNAHPALVVDFWAEWCGPCRMVGPVVEELAMEYAGRVTFAKCNTDDNPNLSGQFAISAIPTLLFFLHWKLIDRVTGAYPKDALKKRVETAFGTSTRGN